MALWEDSLRGLDSLTLSTIVQLQLEDSQELTSNAKGKQREGTLSDAELALQLYTEDLTSTDAVLNDRVMARSMALAILHDGHLIQRVTEQEQQVSRDHELASSMQNGSSAPLNIDIPSGTGPPQSQDMWTDPEFLEKAGTLYMQQPDAGNTSLPALVVDSDSDDATVAESSAWASHRKPKGTPKLGHCVACGDDKDFRDVARVRCKHQHEYCRDCLAQLFELSMTDESLFPPRCDQEEIPLSLVRFFLPSDLAKCFEAKYAELSTRDKVYCHDPQCAEWIPKSAINHDTNVSTCPRCEKTTCEMCKLASHTGDCPEDDALQQLVSLANEEQWQRCLDCKRFVELGVGCNHMSCRCGAQFCYVCGARWKTCGCPQAHEDRLYARAANIVDRDPNRRHRLYAPERVPHAQPVSRRPSVVASDQILQGVDNGPHSIADRDNNDDDNVAALTHTEPATSTLPAAAPPSWQDRLRTMRIAQVFENLQANHDCSHDRWRWVKGAHECEECHHTLREYIFECRQCELQACNRCKRNRL